MKYSFNIEINKDSLAYAYKEDINASYKDLGAVCDAVRYLKASSAVALTEKLSRMEMPILFRRHNKHMGARHELHGRKGKYPVKAAKEVRLVLLNAIANANNKALPGEDLIVLHASANKTQIVRRQPSKGGISWGRGMYGRSALMHSDIEYAKIEIVLGTPDEKELTKNMKYFIHKKSRISKKLESVERVKTIKKEKPKDTKDSKETKVKLNPKPKSEEHEHKTENKQKEKDSKSEIKSEKTTEIKKENVDNNTSKSKE
ncbi:MAG: uL22 family ribosomal protein [Candidatus Micrarchaeaceae archaeon]